MGSGSRGPRRAARLLLAAALLALPQAALAGDGLSLERIYSDPRLAGVPPREVAWSPSAAVAGYLWSERGLRARDLWIYDAEKGLARKLTDITSMEGAPDSGDEAIAERRETMRLLDEGIDAFRWSPDGKRILFTYREDLFLTDLEGGDPKRLTSTEAAEFDPRFSPDGKHVAFVRDNDLHVIRLADRKDTPVTTDGSERLLNGLSDYISLEELARYSAYRWSGDGKYLVYIQADVGPVSQLEIPDYLTPRVSHRLQRRPPAGEENARTRVGVVSSTGGETRWLTLRDGLRDFYIPKLERAGDRIFLVQQERALKRAWLYLVDPAGAKARPILEEEDGAWINWDRTYPHGPDKGDLLLWSSERSGWAHLYGIDPLGGDPRPITFGSWEVTKVDRVVDNRIHFTGTYHGSAERHLYRVSAGGGEPERLTGRPGWNEAEVSADGLWMAVLHSDITVPTDLWVGRVGSEKLKRVTRSPAKDFKSLDLPEPEFLTLKSRADGEPLRAMLFRPSRHSPRAALSRGGRHPAIVRVHGAGYAQSNRRKWGGTTYLFHTLMTRRGYYVLDVDFRGSSGYGRKWRTDVHLHLGGLDLEDTVTAAEYLRTLSKVDPERIGIWGWSYGGFLVNMAMLARPEVFNAGVAVAPVNDWAAYDTHYTEERLGHPAEEKEAYRKSSPQTYASGLKRPLLMVHGLRDDNVHARDTWRLVDALVKEGRDFEMMIYPEAKHGIRRDSSRVHLFSKIVRFFAERMRPR